VVLVLPNFLLNKKKDKRTMRFSPAIFCLLSPMPRCAHVFKCHTQGSSTAGNKRHEHQDSRQPLKSEYVEFAAQSTEGLKATDFAFQSDYLVSN
jgi:hypothetical protein